VRHSRLNRAAPSCWVRVTKAVHTPVRAPICGRHLGVSVVLVLFLTLLAACDNNTRNLGGGFRLVHQRTRSGEATPATSSAHPHHLYYQSKDLGIVGNCFVSPSGCHALFEQNGKLMLFHACSESLKPITDLRGAVPSQITWSESRNEAVVSYSSLRSVTVVPLSTCACTIESRPLRARKETAANR